MEADIVSLRKAAPNWSLAGDKQLLEMLQKIHQKIMTKCEEANMKLDAMVDALDNASIDLQNVNNKFMALSNSQFVESRVYDDDVDVSTGENIAKIEPVKVDAESEITKLKHSLQRLEQMHEPVHILDSDSSDDEDDGRIILKPKDVYAHRPLPYIIGSQAWKSKWHAGLIQEESDSDISESKQEYIGVYNDEYSESEPETAPTTEKLTHRTISSSSMESELTSQPQATSQTTRQPVKPADIAAELARRLGGVQLPASEPVPIETPPEPTTKKVYRVEKPAPTTIFSDEPPPLDDYQSYKSDSTDDDDIFAQLHKKPNTSENRGQNRVAKDLFGGFRENIVDDLFGEVEARDSDKEIGVDYQNVKPSTSFKGKSPTFDERQEANSVKENPETKQRPIETKDVSEIAVKKPVGGISLFGNNKDAESIGAAILKRNQRKSTSEEESTTTENQEIISSVELNKEPVNKIIEDLFNKPSKKLTKNDGIIRKEETEKVKPTKDKIDLFSDNLFDDIDDIFTTNIATKAKENKPQKSIFDEDDDLFADITLKKPETYNDKSNTKSIFNSNDDLFSHSKNNTEAKIPSNSIKVDKNDLTAKENVSGKVQNNNKTKQIISESIFDDDSEDNLFSDIKKVSDYDKSQKPTIENVKEKIVVTTDSKIILSSSNSVHNDVSINNKSESENLLYPVNSESQLESPSVFDDDEFEDLFTARPKSSTEQSNLNVLEENKYTIEDTKITKTVRSNETICKEVTPQETSNTIVRTKQALGSDTEILESIPKTNVYEKNNSHISDEKYQPKILQSEENLDVENKILDDSKTNYLSDADFSSKNLEDSKQSASFNEDFNTILSSDSIPELGKCETTESSIISEIFTDMPPAFEKPVEPKRSKNVNALFDDDSDDEALFFKKSEVISDEKPELNFNSDRFRIFHDEPPEIDIDFSQKPLKNCSKTSNLADDDLFLVSPTLKSHTSSNNIEDKILKVNKSPEICFRSEGDKTTNVVNITELIEDSIKTHKSQEINVSELLESYEENTEMDSTENINDTLQGETKMFINNDITEETEQRKFIGKLKPMNFNINVNTLLPVASLKKSKISEETDGQTISTKSNEELNIHSTEKVESKIGKSVSFDGDPESEVLDNTFSKERAKIQVKRRPSSRRARLEAVRKSRIELVSDSTDNSSSFDEPPYKEIVGREKIEDTVDSTMRQTRSSINDIFKDNTNKLDTPNSINKISHSLPETLLKAKIQDTKNTQADIKSKVVYILNDEDIFNNISPMDEDQNKNKNVQNNKVLDIVDDDDDILFKTPNISTLGKTYETSSVSSSYNLKIESKSNVSKENIEKTSEAVKHNLPKTKKSLFDDLSEDESELFGGSNKPVVQQTNIFNSDSEGELFVKNKKDSNTTIEVKKEVVKTSLFGDESDDDDNLFGVKANKVSGKARKIEKKPKDCIENTSEPVFEDPLSMFGNDS